MPEKKQRNIGQILIEKGIVTEEQIKDALSMQKEKPDLRIGQALVQMQAATSDQVYQALGELLGYKFVDLRTTRISAEAVEAMPRTIARKHTVVAIGEEDGVLIVAITDPFDLSAIDSLQFYLNRPVRCVLATPEAVEEAISKYYGIEESTVDNMLAEFTESDLGIDTGQAQEKFQEDGEDSAMIRLVHLLISEAVKMRASDIHIEPMKTKLRVRYRVDGNCQEMDSPPKKLQNPIISRVKILAGIDIAERRRPTDGRISMRVGNQAFDIRVSCLPAVHGESVVMRLLMKESVLINLQELGFHETDYRRFESIIKRPNGIFLVTGPTGSGKTTTLYAALHELNRPDKKIITAENPVEYNLSGINQCEVRERIGLTFGAILRSMLRQAPNIILIGEIRDPETAEIAVQAALTGHLVFSTLHTNDAPSAITRLIDMGVKPFLVASSVQAIMAQRLVRRICSGCKTPMQYDRKMLASIGLKAEEVKNVTFYHGAGCQRCRNSGFRGRTAIFELMELDNTLRDMTFRREPLTELRKHARSSGMVSLREDGVRKVLAGATTIPEVLEVTARDEAEVTMESRGRRIKEVLQQMQISRLLQTIVNKGASDLILTVASRPMLRLQGRLVPLETKVLEPDDTVALMKSITSERCQQELQEVGSTDFGFSFGDQARFRVAVFKQRGNTGIVLRLIPNKLMTFEDIGLGEVVKKLLWRPRGLVLVTGPTGSGKTTTLATMIDYINTNRDTHIITIEDPIEYYHNHRKSVITQRELGVDVPSFAEGLRRALRQNPDVILVGEMRDLETMETAISAAETGHLVFATLHTNSAGTTINRIVDAFPPQQQEQIRIQLASNLIAVICQALLPDSTGKGRVAAFEVMIQTSAISNLIRSQKVYQLPSEIQTGSALGMILLDDSLARLYHAGRITEEEALNRAQNLEEMMEKLKMPPRAVAADAASQQQKQQQHRVVINAARKLHG